MTEKARIEDMYAVHRARLEAMHATGQNSEQVRRALQKIDKDLYGVCEHEDCRTIIHFDRLLSEPTAKYCTECQSALEEAQRRQHITNAPTVQRSLGYLY